MKFADLNLPPLKLQKSDVRRLLKLRKTAKRELDIQARRNSLKTVNNLADNGPSF